MAPIFFGASGEAGVNDANPSSSSRVASSPGIRTGSGPLDATPARNSISASSSPSASSRPTPRSDELGPPTPMKALPPLHLACFKGDLFSVLDRISSDGAAAIHRTVTMRNQQNQVVRGVSMQYQRPGNHF